MNTNIKGQITEVEILNVIIKMGYAVSIPFGEKEKYDQIWDINNKLLKIQVKTCRWKDEEKKQALKFNCYSVTNGRKSYYTKQDIDFFATFWNNQCYLIPVEECSSEKTLWFEKPSNNNPNCCFAKNYLVEEVLKNF